MRLLLVFGFLLFSTMTQAEKVVRVGIEHWPPNSYVLEGHVSGIDVEVVNELVKAINYRLEWIECPWKRCIRLLEEGKIELLTSMRKTVDRERYVTFLEPAYYHSSKVFYLLQDSKLSIDTYEDLYALVIGVPLGQNTDKRFDSDQGLNKVELVKEELLLQMLLKGRVDTILSVEHYADHLIKQKGLEGKFRKAKFRYSGTGGFIGVSKASKINNLQHQLNQSLMKIINDGTVTEVVNRVMEGKGRKFPIYSDSDSGNN